MKFKEMGSHEVIHATEHTVRVGAKRVHNAMTISRVTSERATDEVLLKSGTENTATQESNLQESWNKTRQCQAIKSQDDAPR